MGIRSNLDRREVDLLVAGAGPAGMAAALVASLEGLDVLLVEKSQQVGGTGATAAGTLWIPGNRQSRAAGYEDSAEAAAAYLDALCGTGSGRELREVYLATGPDVIDYLMARTAVQFAPCGKHPDYQSQLAGAAVSGRAIVPVLFDGRRLGADFARVRPPIPEFMVLGGMMFGKDDLPHLIRRFSAPRDFLYSARLFARYLLDRLRYPRGTRLTMGNALVARLFLSLRDRGVQIAFGTSLKALVGGPGGVQGAILEGDEGRRIEVVARKGVVLATGGYGRNPDFRAAFMPKPVPHHSLAAPGVTGDGVRAGWALGARVSPHEHGTGAFWSPVSITRRRDGSSGLFPHLSLDRAKPGLIAVNSAGRRFVDEGASYHDFVEAMFQAHRTTPSIPAYLVCEADFVRRYGLGLIHPGTRDLSRHVASGYLSLAPTLGALARRIGVDPAGLEETVRRHNAFARDGRDLDFGKGDKELARFNGDPGHAPNPCLAPIERGPFCAMAVWPADIACSTGLATDADGRALDEQGAPIPGLFACGNDMASIMAGAYPGPGTTLGPGVVFAYRAAMRAAQSPAKSLEAAAPAADARPGRRRGAKIERTADPLS